MRKITLNENGTIEHLWPFNAPESAVEVPDNVAVDLLNNRNSKALIEGEVVEFTPAFNFTNAFEIKLSEVVAAYKTAMMPIKANYTDEDIASFPTQESEAKAWNADNNAETELLDYMLANRPSIDKPTLVTRILANAVIYKQIAGPAIGKKQHFEDLLYALLEQHEDAEQPDVAQSDFDAIVVDFI